MKDVRFLLEASNNGDQAAYEELLNWLYIHTLSQLRKHLAPYVNFPKESIEDIRQEVLITFHKTHQTFDTTRPLLPWVNAIIKHKMIDFLRRKDFIVAMTSQGLETLEEIPVHAAQESNDIEQLNNLLTHLTPKQFEILRLSKIEGLTSKEIAKKMALNDSNVKVMLHRIVKLLKLQFVGEGDGQD